MEENLKWLWYAFSAAWLVHLAYVGTLAARERKLRDQIESLKAMLEERGKR